MPLLDRAQAAELDADDWLSVGAVAHLFGCHPDTIYTRLRLGTLPCRWIRLGRQWRIHRGDAEAIAPLVRQYGDLAAAELAEGAP